MDAVDVPTYCLIIFNMWALSKKWQVAAWVSFLRTAPQHMFKVYFCTYSVAKYMLPASDFCA